ncbi:MAG TPA: KpsF/GutQ family sugar-phosphate isomerase [Gemmataceae bacterium]|nr:KpsF/GutQ family sugar-phosphate isomerase [Gemmataceae bacterium]
MITDNSSPGTKPRANGPTAPGGLPASRAEMVRTFLEVLTQEKEALQAVAGRVGAAPEAIGAACELIWSATTRASRGRVIVSGIGKAGLIGRKIAATLSSTGTASAFVHPVEALHGDLGFVQDGDCGLLLSYSGETVELVRLARELTRIGCPLVVITRAAGSTLGKLATTCLELGEVPEACYMGLAPSSSTTAMLALGDALALAVAKAKGFTERDFGRNHPAGSLGQRYRCIVDLMRTGPRLVCVAADTRLKRVIQLVSQAKTGAAILVRPDRTLLGLFTDGDLRRAVLQGEMVLDEEIWKFASIPCHFIHSDGSVADALKLFHNNRIEDLPVVDRSTGEVIGMLCLKDIAAF